MLCIAGDIHRQRVPRLIGNDQGLFLAIEVCLQAELAIAVQGSFPAVKSYGHYILIADLNSCFLAVAVVPTVHHIFYRRRDRVDLKALRGGISHIAGVVGQLYIDHILIIVGKVNDSGVFRESRGLDSFPAQRDIADKVFDFYGVPGFVIARLGVAVVLCGDFRLNLLLIEQAEGNGVQEGLPPGTLIDLDFTRRRNGIYCKIAVLTVADRADCLFKISCLAVVFAAVMWAGIIALGALAVNKCVLV